MWPTIARALLAANVRLQCDSSTLAVVQSLSPPPANVETYVQAATPESYTTEHLTTTISVITVPSLSAAVQHINSHSSHHTDAIITENEETASNFVRAVDSAGTFVNASTRFADGFRYGFGTEVGISTGRIHARGPVGLEGLVIYKYVLRSKDKKGHIVGEFGSGKKQFKHKPIDASALPF